MRFGPPSWLVAVAALLVPAQSRAQALPSDCPALGDALVQHSCFHTVHGPFKSVQATPGEAVAAGTPDLDSVHTEYRVGLAGDTSVVTYTPERSGAWTLFLGGALPIRVFDESGRERPRIFSAAGDVGCAGLVRAHVFELEGGVQHRLVFGSSTAASVVVVVEFVDDFLIENGRDRDGDGFGTPADSVRTPCAPPSGYVQNASDCDDSDPSLHPRAPETCDGVDQNCNGLADDEGLECRVGTGECRAVGNLICDGHAGEPVRCSVEPRPAQSESCNGKDDDCDGTIDGSHTLCSHADTGPSCVREGFSALCGCSLDQDCGPEDSGRVCDAKQHRCVDGCSGAKGRNGCPEGQSCVESEAGPAECVADEFEDGAPENAAVSADDGTKGRSSLDAGCGCRVAGRKSRGSLILFIGSLAGIAALRRRFFRNASRSASSVLALVVGAMLGASACGGRSVSRGEWDAASGTCDPVLGATAVAHACSHTDNGPYVPVAALASSAPDVSELHKTFSVLIVDEGAALIYRPRRHGEHVFVTDRPVTIEVVRRDAVQRHEGAPFKVEGCRSIEQALRAELVADVEYQLRLLEPSQTEFRLFVEYPPAFGAKAWNSCAP